jgi:hypothetical protein
MENEMMELKLGAIGMEKPIKVTIELFGHCTDARGAGCRLARLRGIRRWPNT